MSHLAIASSLLSFSPVSHRAPAPLADLLPISVPVTRAVPAPAVRPSQLRRPLAQPSQPSQLPALFDWLRLATRQLFRAELEARLEPYRACRCCVAQVRWCGEGVPTGTVPLDRSAGAPHGGIAGIAGITPLTPSLVLGANADPYSAAEATQRLTQRTLRRLLELFAGDPREISTISGIEISILTRSPLLLRDLDLLVDLDRRHAVTVSVLIPAAEAELASRIEANPSPPSPPSPDSRFELVHTLAAHGIATRVVCTPIQPGLNNSVAVLRRLLARAHEAGAFDVSPAPRHPALRPTSAESRQLLALFHRLRLEHGFPRTSPGRA
jgi:hypothetical protein